MTGVDAVVLNAAVRRDVAHMRVVAQPEHRSLRHFEHRAADERELFLDRCAAALCDIAHVNIGTRLPNDHPHLLVRFDLRSVLERRVDR